MLNLDIDKVQKNWNNESTGLSLAYISNKLSSSSLFWISNINQISNGFDTEMALVTLMASELSPSPHGSSQDHKNTLLVEHN